MKYTITSLSKIFIMLAATLAITSCSTLFGDNTRQINVKSNPSGATIYLNNQSVGTTPQTITLPTYIYNGEAITLKKAGYQSQTVILSSAFQPVGLWNVLNLGFGFLIDGATGTFVKIDPASLNINQNLQRK